MPEFQAIILAAGTGSRMRELTKKKPKCLLPIGNKPMLCYPIESLQKAGFREVIILVPDKNFTEIASEMKQRYSSSDLDLTFVPVSVEKQYGTAESLAMIRDNIVSDCIVVSCDIITDHPLLEMINIFRTYEPALVTLFSITNPTGSSRCYGSAKMGRGEKDLIAIEEPSSSEVQKNDRPQRLVLFHSESDFGQNIPFPMDALDTCHSLKVMSNWFDSHIYLIRKSAFDHLLKDSNMSSLKGEFVSHLVDKQFDISENENYKDNEHLLDLFEQTALTFDLGDDEKRGLLLQDKKSLSSKRTICLTDIIRPPSYCIRSNNIAGFIEANKKIAEVSWTPVTAGGRTKNFLNSIIGENSIVADSSHIIRSVIGNNCTIGSHVKITDCVIFDGVTIEDGCILQQTVVCSDSKIGRKSSLERCIVSSGYKVHTESQFADEFLADGEEGEFVVE